MNGNTSNSNFGAREIVLLATLFGFSNVALATLSSINPFEGADFYINPDYASEVKTFFDDNPDYLAKAQKLKLVDGNNAWNISTAIWLDSMQAIVGYPSDGRATHSMLYYLKNAAEQAASTPVTITFVVYDLPLRDCAAFSSNGEFRSASDIDKYKANYIGTVPKKTQKEAATDRESFMATTSSDTAIPTTITDTLQRFYDGTTPNANNVRIVLIIEPDSLPNMITNSNATAQCSEVSSNKTYTTGISYALTTLDTFNTTEHPNIFMYLDIAHSAWMGWEDNINKFASIYNNTTLPGFNAIRGFISNTANYTPLKEDFSYADYLKQKAIIKSDYYSWNDVYDEVSYIAEIMSLNKDNGQLQVNDHLITAPSSKYYADKHFLVDTSRNGWLLNTTDYTATGYDNVTFTYPRRDQRHHNGNWCNIESVQTKSTTYETKPVPTIPTSAGLGIRPTAAPKVANPLYSDSPLPIDAYVWIKPPLESDGFYSNGTGDRMCGPDDGGAHNANQSTDSLQNGTEPAPQAGFVFPAAFKNLIDVAGCIQKVFTSTFCK